MRGTGAPKDCRVAPQPWSSLSLAARRGGQPEGSACTYCASPWWCTRECSYTSRQDIRPLPRERETRRPVLLALTYESALTLLMRCRSGLLIGFLFEISFLCRCTQSTCGTLRVWGQRALLQFGTPAISQMFLWLPGCRCPGDACIIFILPPKDQSTAVYLRCHWRGPPSPGSGL